MHSIMSDGDLFVYDSSLQGAPDKLSRFSKQKVMRFSDVNQGSYSGGEVQFVLPSLSVNNVFVSLAESYITVPYRIRVKGTRNFTMKDDAAALKGSFLTLVDSFSLKLDNTQICTRQPLSHIPMHFELLQKSTQNDVANSWPSIGMVVEDDVFDYRKIMGEHQLHGGDAAPIPSLTARAKAINFDPAAARTAKFMNLANTTALHKTNRVTAAAQVDYHVLAHIPLKHLSPVFRNAQLVKGPFIELFLNINSGTASFTIEMPLGGAGQAAVTDAMVKDVVCAPRFDTFPVQIIPKRMTALRDAAVDQDTVITVSCEIATDLNHGERSCMFNAVLYEMRPEEELKYMEALPSKLIRYPDYHLYTHRRITPNSSERLMVINSAVKLRSLLIHTSMSQTFNGDVAQDLPADAGGLPAPVGAYSTLASPFTTAPVTCAPYATLGKFQVRIAGQLLFPEPQEFNYELFTRQFQNSASILDEEMSGVLDIEKWSSRYGYIYVDLTRKMNDAEDLMNKSVEIEFVNNSTYPIDIRCFLEREEAFTMSTMLGKVSRA